MDLQVKGVHIFSSKKYTVPFNSDGLVFLPSLCVPKIQTKRRSQAVTIIDLFNGGIKLARVYFGGLALLHGLCLYSGALTVARESDAVRWGCLFYYVFAVAACNKKWKS